MFQECRHINSNAPKTKYSEPAAHPAKQKTLFKKAAHP